MTAEHTHIEADVEHLSNRHSRLDSQPTGRQAHKVGHVFMRNIHAFWLSSGSWGKKAVSLALCVKATRLQKEAFERTRCIDDVASTVSRRMINPRLWSIIFLILNWSLLNNYGAMRRQELFDAVLG